MIGEIKKFLFDISRSAESIDLHLQNKLNFDEYKNNLTVKRAVEREFEIIGEAVRRILELDASISIPDSRKIIALRNKIIHGYDIIDDAVIWSIIVNDLPKLKAQIHKLLDEK